jgi:RNA-binding protein YlmH
MENNSYTLKEGDILVIRGLGKFIYNGCGNETRKGRVYVSLQKYV